MTAADYEERNAQLLAQRLYETARRRAWLEGLREWPSWIDLNLHQRAAWEAVAEEVMEMRDEAAEDG